MANKRTASSVFEQREANSWQLVLALRTTSKHLATLMWTTTIKTNDRQPITLPLAYAWGIITLQQLYPCNIQIIWRCRLLVIMFIFRIQKWSQDSRLCIVAIEKIYVTYLSTRITTICKHTMVVDHITFWYTQDILSLNRKIHHDSPNDIQSKVIHLILFIHKPHFGDCMPSSNQWWIAYNYIV